MFQAMSDGDMRARLRKHHSSCRDLPSPITQLKKRRLTEKRNAKLVICVHFEHNWLVALFL